MKKNKLIFSLLIAILFAFGCKKEHIPISTTSVSEFYFNGTINGIATSFNAGVNDYYMYSSYMQDSNNVYGFIGDLKQTASNLNSIQIQINDYKASTLNAPVNVDSSLTTGNYLYYVPGIGTSSTVYKAYFSATTANGTPQNYQWDFGDGQSASLTVPNTTHIYSTVGNYTANLTVNFAGGCSSSASNQIRANAQGTNFKATATYSVDSADSYKLNFSANSNKPSTNYFWDFGDGGTSTSGYPTYTYTSSAIYAVSLLAIDSLTSDSDRINLNVSTGGYVHCLTNFTDSISTMVVTSASALSKVIITYTDASGNIYTSKNVAQPTSSNFQIISVDNYQNNSNNQTTKKLHVKFNCWVYNAAHTPTQITNADAVIAVAYK